MIIGKDSWKKGLILFLASAVVGISSFYTFTMDNILGYVAGLGNLAVGGYAIYNQYKQWSNE